MCLRFGREQLIIMLRYMPYVLIVLIGCNDLLPINLLFIQVAGVSNKNQTVNFLNNEANWPRLPNQQSSTNSPFLQNGPRQSNSNSQNNHRNVPNFSPSQNNAGLHIGTENGRGRFNAPSATLTQNNNRVAQQQQPSANANNRIVSLSEILGNSNYSPITPTTNPIAAGSTIPGSISQQTPKQNHLPILPIENQNRANPTTVRTTQIPGSSSQSKPNGEDEELRAFSESLLPKDVNNAAKYVTVNIQGKTTSHSRKDEAPQPLLNVAKEAYGISTIAKFMALYDNYILETSQNEQVTPNEIDEENRLLDEVIATPVMQMTRNFLVEKGKLGRNPQEFRDILKQIWFGMYSRGQGRTGSSGFEHVFLAELNKGAVSGFHNWIYFSEEEKRNNANYLGYLKKTDFGDKGAIIKYHVKFHNVDKPVGSMFVGTSPELEMALYSLCFILREDHVCPLRLNGKNFIIRTFAFRYRGKKYVGSAFPEI